VRVSEGDLVLASAADDLAPSRAIIDVGSNTVRLVVYGGPERAPAVLHNEKVTARLGKGVAETGRLAKKPMAAALAALARYRCLLDLQGVQRVDVVATAAVRDAADGEAFLARVAALGYAPRLLGGEEEALTSAAGVIGAFPGAVGVVADLGGGSLELVDIDGAECHHGVSLPLGTLRLPALRGGAPGSFSRKVGAMLAEVDWTAPHGATLYLVGGSFRSFARAAMHQLAWPCDDPHGFALAAPMPWPWRGGWPTAAPPRRCRSRGSAPGASPPCPMRRPCSTPWFARLPPSGWCSPRGGCARACCSPGSMRKPARRIR